MKTSARAGAALPALGLGAAANVRGARDRRLLMRKTP
ncbi:hypothetical protein BURPSS13_I0971 [Burkholderia pseudomallei S13]|nr:hypothetical protein BURPSS13_I0971 [Burkholderia pseudomallei S13]